MTEYTYGVDYQYIENHMGPAILSGCLLYGNTPQETTGSALLQMVSESASFVNSILADSGYNLPLISFGTGEEAQPAYLKKIITFKTITSLYNKSCQPVPQNILDECLLQEGWLMAVNEGKVKLPGVNEDSFGAINGGHLFGTANSTNNPVTGGNDRFLLSVSRLRNGW